MKTPRSLVTLCASQQTRLAELRAMQTRHDAAWKRHASFARNGASSANAEQQAKIKADAGFDFTNEMRAELENLEFLTDPPVRLFCYPSNDGKRLTGFMGNALVVVSVYGGLGHEYRSAFGDKRRSVRGTGINGLRYHGTIYGTYARLTVCKAALAS